MRQSFFRSGKGRMSSVFNRSNLKKTIYYLKRNGMKAALAAIGERTRAAYMADYTYQDPGEEVLKGQREQKWENPVVFSILVPAFETREAFFHQLAASLEAQTYPYWELLIADASETDRVERAAADWKDKRIHYVRLPQNRGISENSNIALKQLKGDYIGLLDHDDYLTPNALFEMAMAIEGGKRKGREYELLYSDEDKCDERGSTFHDPHFKLDFNLDLFLTNNYLCHFLVMKRELMQALGFRKAYDGAQDYDLCLRAVARLMEEEKRVEDAICHVPGVLYHWRCHEASTAANPKSKTYAYEAGKSALEDFLKKQGWKARVSHMRHVGFYRVDYEGGVFAQRPDVVAMGGKLLSHGRVAATAFDQEGNPLYEGLPAAYSGYMHRAVLTQDVSRLDIEHWRVNPKYLKKIETISEEIVSKEGEDRFLLEKRLCERLLSLGYRLYWDPEWIRKKEEKQP